MAEQLHPQQLNSSQIPGPDGPFEQPALLEQFQELRDIEHMPDVKTRAPAAVGAQKSLPITLVFPQLLTRPDAIHTDDTDPAGLDFTVRRLSV